MQIHSFIHSFEEMEIVVWDAGHGGCSCRHFAAVTIA